MWLPQFEPVISDLGASECRTRPSCDGFDMAHRNLNLCLGSIVMACVVLGLISAGGESRAVLSSVCLSRLPGRFRPPDARRRTRAL